jgi:hypothetical protein
MFIKIVLIVILILLTYKFYKTTRNDLTEKELKRNLYRKERFLK